MNYVNRQISEDLNQPSIADLMPSCGNMLCSCKDPEKNIRKKYARKYSRIDDDFTLLKSTSVTDSSTESILRVMEKESYEYVSFRPNGFLPMWIIDTLEVDNEKSKYVKSLRCRYNDSQVCDCTARIKIVYNVSLNVVDTLWWNYASAHCVPVGKDGMFRFETYMSHKKFQHVRCKIIDEVSRNKTQPLTIELQEQLEKLVVKNPSVKPRNVFSSVKRLFPQYSSIYWKKVKSPITSYRKTLLKRMELKGKTNNT